MNLSTDENTTDEDYNSSFNYPDIALSYPLRFWLLLVFDIPAIIFSFIVLFYLLSFKNQRQALNNHTFILLLCLTLATLLIDIPFYLNYLRIEYVWPDNPATCYIWWFINVAFSATSNILMSFASFERHILIFHDRLLLSKRKRFFLHYLPHIILLLYCFIFYTIAFFFPSCENVFIYTIPYCSFPCYFYVYNFLNIWDVLVNGVLPALTIALFNLILLFRVIYQKHIRLRQPLIWRKHRRMMLQVLTVSLLYLLFCFPTMILALIKLCGYSSSIGDEIVSYTYFFSYFIPILLPFICLGSLPDLRKKLKKIFLYLWFFNNKTHVQPFNGQTLTIGKNPVTRTVKP